MARFASARDDGLVALGGTPFRDRPRGVRGRVGPRGTKPRKRQVPREVPTATPQRRLALLTAAVR
jgi:hypothetical protein